MSDACLIRGFNQQITRRHSPMTHNCLAGAEIFGGEIETIDRKPKALFALADNARAYTHAARSVIALASLYDPKGRVPIAHTNTRGKMPAGDNRHFPICSQYLEIQTDCGGKITQGNTQSSWGVESKNKKCGSMMLLHCVSERGLKGCTSDFNLVEIV
jgi:hypothetical protein